MSLFALVVSFGGGIIGAYMGALPVFILTGATTIAGSVTAAVGGADMTMGFTAFGPYLGPHIAFTGGAAASACAGRIKKLGSGADILSCLNGLADPATLLVGGVSGVIGFLIHYLTGTAFHLNTDLPGFTVILLAVIACLVFGSGGLIGKAASGESREYSTSGGGMFCNVISGLGLGTIIGFVCQALLDGGAPAVVIGSYSVSCFGIAAVLSISTQTGFVVPTTYHIALTSILIVVSS